DIDECLTSPCESNFTSCSNTFGSYECVCEDGFEKNSNDLCQDLNECKFATCDWTTSYCTNTVGSYECTCLPGFQKFNTSCDGK
ncbi:hypothetical protein HELRODRAFT_68528, partial [Helobdella robusta]|uniref:EGF-like domain-containing protein n=1 Tax=Helobdella robusta TaxID=6412 RepID=T1FZG4_HELRO